MDRETECLAKRQRIRLDRSRYGEAGRPVLLTVCTRDRRAVLTDEPMARIVAGQLQSTSAKVPVELLVWCVMPDHLHAVVAPIKGGNVID